ncbi:MAG TPA: hypothetical protein VMV29_19120 [Ktedonobacterales bacterium]|nr:hypothetical protein [Ktedonobacterales bacterium]
MNKAYLLAFTGVFLFFALIFSAVPGAGFCVGFFLFLALGGAIWCAVKIGRDMDLIRLHGQRRAQLPTPVQYLPPERHDASAGLFIPDAPDD